MNGFQTRFKAGATGPKAKRWKGGPLFIKYGITAEEYQEMLVKQEYRCAICGRLPKKLRLAIDHDHRTRQVRGLLCFRCNYGLSWFQEDADRLTRAGAYLRLFL